MADLTKIEGWTAKEKKEWNGKVKKQPKHVRDIASKLDPWKLYRLKSTGDRVIVLGFNEGEENGVTVRVEINAKYNLVPFERNVFGIDPNDIEECDLPGPNERLGDLGFTIKQYKDFMSQQKKKVKKPLVN